MKKVKTEKGITLVMLVIYVAMTTAVIGMLATFSSYMYPKLSYINSSSISYEEFNKFNVNFIADIKECPTADVSTSGNGDVLIRLYNYTNQYVYYYKSEENAIYRNNVRIAKNICRFTALEDEYMYASGKTKTYIDVSIATGKDESQIEYEKNINYVLRYWK